MNWDGHERRSGQYLEEVVLEIKEDLSKLTDRFDAFETKYGPYIAGLQKDDQSREELKKSIQKDVARWGVIGVLSVVLVALYEYGIGALKAVLLK